MPNINRDLRSGAAKHVGILHSFTLIGASKLSAAEFRELVRNVHGV